MGREANLWKWLRGNALPRGHYSRIESETSAGFPDINYCIDGCEGNLELKVARHPGSKYPFKKGGLRNTQETWMRDRLEHGGRIILLVQVKTMLYGFGISHSRSWGLSLNYMTLDQIKQTADWTSLKRKDKTLRARFDNLLTGHLYGPPHKIQTRTHRIDREVRAKEVHRAPVRRSRRARDSFLKQLAGD